MITCRRRRAGGEVSARLGCPLACEPRYTYLITYLTGSRSTRVRGPLCQDPTKIPTTHKCYNNNSSYRLLVNVKYSLLFKLLNRTRISQNDALQLFITSLEQHYVKDATDGLHKQITGLKQ